MRLCRPLSFVLIPVVVFIVAALPGCGGGGGGTPSPTPTPLRTAVPRVTVRWPERGRSLDALSSAQSIVITLRAAHQNGSDIVFTVNRGPIIGAHTEVFNAPQYAVVGSWQMQADLYAEAGGTGAKVGTAAGTVTMDVAGNLPFLTTVGIIASVEVTGGQSVIVNQTKDLTFGAKDAGGALIAVSSGSAVFTVTEGTDRMRIANGLAEGLAPGAATVTALVDGVNIAPTPVAVVSLTTITLSPNPAAVSIGGTLTFNATVANAPNTGVTWGVAEGAAGGTISTNGVYTAPSTPGTYTVTATSVYDPAKSTSITVNVQAGGIDVGGEFPPSGGASVIID